MLAGRSVEIARPFPATLKRALVNGKARVEIGGAPHGQLDWLKSLGCFTEIIQYRTRIFIPIDQAEAIIARLLGTGEAL